MLDLETALPKHQDDFTRTNPTSAPVSPPRGFHICRYNAVSSPERVLMLKEPKPRGVSRPPSHEVRQSVFLSLRSSGMAANFEVELYHKVTWLVTFRSADEAQRATGRHITLGNKGTILTPFKANRSQVFLCKNTSQQWTLDDTLTHLLRALPDRRFHVKRSAVQGAQGKRHVVVILSAPSDIEAFQFLPFGGNKCQVRFNGRLDDQTCVVCGGRHLLHQCRTLLSVDLSGNRDQRLLSTMPDIAS